ncbi:ATP-binding cassette domain-containing protein [Amazonocrinis nigriterrae]|nr:ATP-binding cassette domain-containing protein [Amazonocrinis nigriterrae]
MRLGDRVDYYTEKLTGGQKQQVAIARGLMAQPQLVLADEPMPSLDSKTGRYVFDIIQRLAKIFGIIIIL